MLYLEVPGGHVGDELRLVVTLQGIREEEIVGHDAVECLDVTAHYRFDPFVIQLADELLDFDCRMGLTGTIHG